jgi:hypothetical protein
MGVCVAMILHPEGDRIRLILQTDHAAQAGEFARRWGGELFDRPEPFDSVVLATARHDEGWLPWQAAPRIDPATGRPWNFTNIPNLYHIAGHTAGVATLTELDPYAGLLLSLHVAGLYNQRFGYMGHMPIPPIPPEYQPAAASFLAEQAQVQERLVQRLQPDQVRLWTNYRWLQAWDTLSLLICTGWISEEPGLLGRFPTRPGGEEVAIKCWALGGDRYTLSPWPFAEAEIRCPVPARWLPNQTWPSDEAFQQALAHAAWGELPVVLTRID